MRPPDSHLYDSLYDWAAAQDTTDLSRLHGILSNYDTQARPIWSDSLLGIYKAWAKHVIAEFAPGTFDRWHNDADEVLKAMKIDGGYISFYAASRSDGRDIGCYSSLWEVDGVPC